MSTSVSTCSPKAPCQFFLCVAPAPRHGDHDDCRCLVFIISYFCLVYTSLCLLLGAPIRGVAQDFAMSDFSLTLVLQIKTSKIINDMAKVQQKSEKITAFGGIFFVLDKFDSILSSVIDILESFK